jgi:4-hydroxy-3-methylbut-2-enyl diphosphate reductase
MKINLAKSAGFCSGVKRALDIAKKTTLSHQKVVMLGDIVHNEDVVRQIKKSGIKKINTLTKTKDKTLLIRAHGTTLKTYTQAKKSGYKIVDATCPMVKEIHAIAKEMEKKGYKIIVIGDEKHDEVRGIIGQLKKKALVFDIKNPPSATVLKKTKKAAIVVQSTQNEEKIIKVVSSLKEIIPNLKFYNTICYPTRTKQKEIKQMPLKNDVMIIIGSKTSANTKRLYEISKSLNKNSHWIQSAKDLKKSWFKKVKNVGITAGASTPQETISLVVNGIKKLDG